jgi:tetratricopeptide (TPR) repeat protein
LLIGYLHDKRINRAIELSPDNYTTHAARAHTAVEIDHRATAVHELLSAPEFEQHESAFRLLYRWRMAMMEHDYEAARDLFDTARTELEAAMESLPDDPRVLAALSLSYAGLGESDKGRAAANAAVELSPINRDSLIGPIYVLNRARVLAMIGDDDAALADIEHLMNVPLNWGEGPAVIRKDPAFNALLSRAEFRALFPD